MRSAFQGCWTALPTPFRGVGTTGSFETPCIDFQALRSLIERQIREGVAGLVVAGSTGEAAALSATERQSLTAFSGGVAQGRVPVLAGVGTNDTRSTLENAHRAADAGADGLLVVTPYYNRPSQTGLARHFETIARNVRLPIVLYNVPSRTSVDLAPETTVALARSLPNIVAIKEATTPERIARLAEDGALDLFCGEDSWIECTAQDGDGLCGFVDPGIGDAEGEHGGLGAGVLPAPTVGAGEVEGDSKEPESDEVDVEVTIFTSSSIYFLIPAI